MTYPKLIFALCSALFLLFGQSAAFAVECATCDKNLSDCRTAPHTQYVNCAKGSGPKCSEKCAADCKGNATLQKCTLDCVKSCQGGSTCQATYEKASAQCTSTFRNCRKDCTAPR
jgi:hypothetical protein